MLLVTSNLPVLSLTKFCYLSKMNHTHHRESFRDSDGAVKIKFPNLV